MIYIALEGNILIYCPRGQYFDILPARAIYTREKNDRIFILFGLLLHSQFMRTPAIRCVRKLWPQVRQTKMDNVEERAKAFIESQQKKNTLQCTERDVKHFRKYLQSKFVLLDIEGLEAKELDLYLSEYFMDMVKRDGTEYEPETHITLCSKFIFVKYC